MEICLSQRFELHFCRRDGAGFFARVGLGTRPPRWTGDPIRRRRELADESRQLGHDRESSADEPGSLLVRERLLRNQRLRADPTRGANTFCRAGQGRVPSVSYTHLTLPTIYSV